MSDYTVSVGRYLYRVAVKREGMHYNATTECSAPRCGDTLEVLGYLTENGAKRAMNRKLDGHLKKKHSS
jgi:hypothetical protein